VVQFISVEKRKPTYDLEAFKVAFSTIDGLNITGTALRSAAGLGFNRTDIIDIIQTMQRRHFYKSMTSYVNHRIWQDVYHVQSDVGLLYIKFTADVIAEFLAALLQGERR
jgi:motility quorum-sensing regulator / GCU-specific mRNA interferase toxin